MKTHKFKLKTSDLVYLYAAAEAGMFQAKCTKCKKMCNMKEMFEQCSSRKNNE